MCYRKYTLCMLCYTNTGIQRSELPTTVAARSKEWTVFARSNTGILSSNPTPDIDVCVRLLCVSVAGLRRADPPSKEARRLFMD
jgi:hypothetical protein